jgi:MFS family permease
MITLNFPTQERGKALGIYLAAIYVGSTLGPPVGGVLTQYVGWRSLFSISILTGLLSLFLIWQMKKLSDTTTGEKLDIVGGLLCILSVTFLVIGTALLPEANGFWLIAAGTIGIVIFIFWETRVKSPLLNIKLFIHNRTFALSNLVALIIYSATWATSYLLNLHLQYIKGFAPGKAGLILLVMPAIQAVFSPIAGHLSDRFNVKYILSIGMSLTTIGLCLLLFLGDHTPVIQILASLILLGLGLALFVSPNTNAIMGSVANPEYGIASATLSMMRQLGMTFSMVIVSVIFSLYIGQADIIPEYYPSLLASTKTALSVFTILNFTGIIAVFFLRTKRVR